MRSVWFVVGASAGVYVTTKTKRAAEAFTFDGVHDRLSGWFAGARVLTQEVAVARAAKEAELRQQVAARRGTPAALTAVPSPRTYEPPTLTRKAFD